MNLRPLIGVAVLALAVLSASAGSTAPTAKGVVNINTATAEQLQLLPRIGPATAKRIIEFREANGPFKKAEELVAVRGIGEKSLANLLPYVVTEGKTTLTEKVRLPRATSSQQGG
jgi:competence protein ComEA